MPSQGSIPFPYTKTKQCPNGHCFVFGADNRTVTLFNGVPCIAPLTCFFYIWFAVKLYRSNELIVNIYILICLALIFVLFADFNSLYKLMENLVVEFFNSNILFNQIYEKILSVYKSNGAECDLLNLGKDGILTSHLNRTHATVLHVTPFRSFPSGVTASASKRNEYIKWAADRNGIIIEDDFDSEFTVSTKNEDTLFSLEPTHSVIYVNTFTKTVAPSMRIGYMVLPEKLVDSFFSKMGFYSCTVPVFEQYVLAEFINNGDFERHINRIRRKRRQALRDK